MRSGFFKQDYRELVALTDSRVVRAWVAALLLALLALPWLASAYVLSHMTVILFTLVGVLGLNVLTGFTGLISLGHVAFLMLGAYGYAIGVSRLELHPLLAFGLAGAVPAIAGLIVGVPSLRLKGLYLAITTLAFSFIVSAVVLAGGKFTGASRGIMVQRPSIAGFSFGSDQALYGLCLLFAVLTVLVSLNIRRTRLGRAFVAIRDNDIAARTMGIHLWHYKLLAFVISAFITGLSGALMALYVSFVTVEGFPFLLSIEALAILVVGGFGSVLGAVLGTVFIVTLPEVVSAAFGLLGGRYAELLTTSAHEIKSMLYGLVIIAFLRFDPRGLLGIWHDVRRLWVHWPLRY
ncbi:MAG: branched-chain amino acid ABC transporter permease [Burkholderiaceae bacterium]|nr:branched-chain amino acid ABC transporter permease [Burkholderiaceae bacterium]